MDYLGLWIGIGIIGIAVTVIVRTKRRRDRFNAMPPFDP